MSTSELVLACALHLLGPNTDRFAPIRIIDGTPPGASVNAQGFADRREHAIYLIASAPAFRAAAAAQQSAVGRGRCLEQDALKMIASVIVHEQWHLDHGSDEAGAYLAQLTELQRLSAASWTTVDVKRAMRITLQRRARALRTAGPPPLQ